MDSSDTSQWTPRRGMSVHGSNGNKVGEVDAVEPDHVVVRKGFFFPNDHVIPLSAVASHEDDGLYLNVTREQAMTEQWGSASTDGPAITTSATEEPVSAYDTSASSGDMTQAVPSDRTSSARSVRSDHAEGRNRGGSDDPEAETF